MNPTSMQQPNLLIHTTSPYLLQHAYNPISWYPWGPEALEKAQQEDKPIILSIGYAACHWCHVMARESFEDEEVAAIMNKHFVCIKVDREERPDVDQVYIAATQAMGLRVGWPLHVFLLPNQKPFYGGTYFPTETWKRLLENIVPAFKNHRKQLESSAFQFTKALKEIEASQYTQTAAHQQINWEDIKLQFQQVYQELDHKQGGTLGAPKFPMPSLGTYLLHYCLATQDERACRQLNLILESMAYGGIYDHLGGGFARYATDENWLVPHFEKMLYDNAQLISLYAHAYATTQQELYKEVVEQCIAFVVREMMGERGEFYSALDADSEGGEGKFYTWTQQEMEQALGAEAPLLMKYFNATARGNWEDGVNVLYRSLTQEALDLALRQEATQERIQQAQQALFKAREARKRPALDDKVLTAWNGMMLQGLIDAYYALGKAYFLDLARRNASFIEEHLVQGNQVWHSYRKGQLGSLGYLEDYAWVVRAFTSLYQATFEEKWLHQAEALVQYAIAYFWDVQAKLFYFTAQNAEKLIARPKEVFDSVIPSSNAVMAHNLYYLGLLLDKEAYATMAGQMLSIVASLLNQTPLHLSHWASLAMLYVQPAPTVAIVGPACQAWARAIKQHYPGGLVLVGAMQESNLPLLADKKAIQGKTTIYVCQDGVCQAPVHSVDVALAQLGPVLR